MKQLRMRCGPGGFQMIPMYVVANLVAFAMLALFRASAANLVVNIVFFMTHPGVHAYYTVPITMLSLWPLLFASLIPRKAVADNPAIAQPASA